MNVVCKRTLIRILSAILVGMVMFESAIPCVHANVSYQMVLTDTSLSPSSMTARRTESVSIRVTNQGSKPHNLVIKDFYIFTQNLNPGQSVSVSFTPDKTGTFPVYSDVGGKPEPGIRGSITVQ